MFYVQVKDAIFQYATLAQFAGVYRTMASAHSQWASASSDLVERTRQSTIASCCTEYASQIETITIAGTMPHLYVKALQDKAEISERTVTELASEINALRKRVEELERLLTNVDRIGDAHIH